MALDTRLIGRALGLANPVDIGKALDPAIEKGERRFAEQRARREREQVRARKEQIRQEDNTAKSISLLSNINEAGVAPNLRSYISKNAQIIRNEAIEKIKAAKTPAEKIAATMEANQKIGTLAAQSSDFNKYLQNFADLKPEDISKLNQEGIGEQATNILDGNFKITDDGKFDFGNGKIADFNQVINTNYINKRSDKYLELLKIADNVGTKYGLAGTTSGFFKDKLQNSLSTVKMSDLDLMSVAVDHFGIEDFKGAEANLIERIKEDFDADGDIDDVGLRTQLRQAINNRIQAASESVYSKAKAEYNKKVVVKNQKEDLFIKNEADKIYKTLVKATGPAQTGTGDIDKGLFVNKKLFGGYVIDSKNTPIKQDGNMLAIPVATGTDSVEYKEIDLSNYNEVNNLMRELLVQKYGADANTDAILRIMPEVIGEFDPNWQMGGSMIMPKEPANNNEINNEFAK
jgi:hypothetical protein|tara:strand:+ start:2728 stop:4107 length:1380 start_codon:yes stop_codon:yes gene_type:complete